MTTSYFFMKTSNFLTKNVLHGVLKCSGTNLHATKVLNSVKLSCCKSFHSSNVYRAKHFKEIENEYAHGIMEKKIAYSSTILKHPLATIDTGNQSYIDADRQNAFAEFYAKTEKNFTDNLTLESSEFSDLVQSLYRAIPNASDENINRTLHFLCLWPPTKTTYVKNFKLLWNKLDYECYRRLKRWNMTQKFLIADYWFHLRLSRITMYNSGFIENSVYDLDSFKSHQFVQLMFYINLQRKVSNGIVPPLVKKLVSVIDDLSIEELGIVCLGFFKTSSKAHSSFLIKSVIKILTSEVMNTEPITIAAILKFLRKSLHIELNDQYIALMHTCIPCIEKWDVLTSVHLALLSSEANIYHPMLLDRVTEKLTTEIENARIKDGTKLLQCLSHFNHYPNSKFHTLFLAELNKDCRKVEIDMRPQDLVFTSLFYAYLGHYDFSLIQTILKPEFVDYCLNTHGTGVKPSLVEIDYCVEIECPKYKGPRLGRYHLKTIEHRRGNMPSNSLYQNTQTRLIADLFKYLSDIQGTDDNILIRHVLPHIFSPDIVVRLSPQNGQKSLSELYRNLPGETILKPPDNEIWACFVASGNYTFAHRSKYMTGVTQMKLRQLEKLGYKVIFIPFFDMPNGEIQRKNFIKEKMEKLKDSIKLNVGM